MIVKQNRSPLFRLPGELRNKIYEHYISEEGGYVYNSEERTFQNTQGKNIDNSLQYTCKKAAQEMEATGLKYNMITFKSWSTVNKGIDVLSDASLFEELLRRKHRALQFMLGFSYHRVTTDILNNLCSKWPKVQAVEELKQKIVRDGPGYLHSGDLALYAFDYAVETHTTVRVLEDLIDLLATRSNFESLTAVGYSTSAKSRFRMGKTLNSVDMEDIDDDTSIYIEGDAIIDEETGEAIYTRETRPLILEWRPKPWEIPGLQELESVRCFLPGPSPRPEFSSTGCEYVEELHFSATAVAIDFLGRLTTKQRSNLRAVNIQENRASINQPHRHSHGLIPFCQDNPQLRIIQRVDIWYTDFIPNSDPEYYIPHGAWWSIFRWMNEAKALHANGMPKGSFSLVLHGTSTDASQNLSDMVLKVAAWQDANAEYFRRQQEKFNPCRNGVIKGFPGIVREALQGQIPVRIESEVKQEIWDTAKILSDHEGPWPTLFEEAVPEHPFVEPAGGWEAARNENRVEVDYLDRLEGWDRLLESDR